MDSNEPRNNPPSKRLKVLISAYACEPGKGSEPEVGWQWAVQMARFHDVTVLTRTNNREQIESSALKIPAEHGSLRFIYHDLPPIALRLKKCISRPILYYLLWQISLKKVVRKLVEQEHFDLLHHVTFAAVRYPTAFANLKVPTIWGPVGGMEETPWRFLNFNFPKASLSEGLRNIANRIGRSRCGSLKSRARQHTTVIASTRETQTPLTKLGIDSPLLPAIGLKAGTLHPSPKHDGSLKLLYVGNLLFLKGLDLALRALSESQTAATLTLIGDGPFRASLEKLTQDLGLSSRVSFQGRRPREAVLAAYSQFDAFLFPSLHDSGAFAALEAMSQELPVICLDCGGPGLAVTPECGWKIAPHSRTQTIHDLAQAIRAADSDRGGLQAKGKAARENVIRRYDWDVQGNAMNAIYQQTLQRWNKPDETV